MSFSRRIALAAVTAFSLPLVASAQTPLLSYNFDEAGTQAFATGSAATAGAPALTIMGSGAARGAPGSGVTGKASDRAFDNTLGSGIFGGGEAAHAGDFQPIDALNSFTLTGWYYIAPGGEAIGRQASLIENINYQASSSTQGGYGVTGASSANAGALRVRVNEVTGVESAPGTYADVGKYVNFAVTYDGTLGVVNFYKGLVNQPVTLVGTAAYAKGPVADESQPLILGESSGGSSLTFNPFNGLIDDVGIYGQALTLPQIEALRQSVVPEPTTLAALGLSTMLLRRRRA